jgi:large subunit ribosomal protein L28
MPRVCHFTGKKTQTGWIRAEKGARRDGGVGNKIKGRTKRKVRPNLKKIRVVLPDGDIKKVWVSARALKSGAVVRPSRVVVAAKSV